MREIVVISGKGGTGKTSVCAALAHLASLPSMLPVSQSANQLADQSSNKLSGQSFGQSSGQSARLPISQPAHQPVRQPVRQSASLAEPCLVSTHVVAEHGVYESSPEAAHRPTAPAGAIVCDLDVDAPDLHILLDPAVQRREDFISGHEARIDQAACQHCGQCTQVCRFDAVRVEQDTVSIDPLRCEGCGVCVTLCPAQAIQFPEKHCGEWYVSETRFGTLVHALLSPGEENSGRLVSVLKQQARTLAKERGSEIILCDGSPGVGCPVISSLSGAHVAVIVVEPTPSGNHDFQRVAALCDQFRIPVAVLINKADLNPEETLRIAEYAQAHGYTVVGELPFDMAMTEAMLQRRAITEIASPSTSAPESSAPESREAEARGTEASSSTLGLSDEPLSAARLSGVGAWDAQVRTTTSSHSVTGQDDASYSLLSAEPMFLAGHEATQQPPQHSPHLAERLRDSWQRILTLAYAPREKRGSLH